MPEMDHLFIMASHDAPETERLTGLGLVEGRGRRHVGQGTTNRCFFFRNVMLELLWVDDPEVAQSPPIRRTRLWERWSGRDDAASPFGFCFRPEDGADREPPFPAWRYRPPYLPESLFISIADDTPLAEPMWFHTIAGMRPDARPPEERQPLEHPVGIRELTGVAVAGPGLDRPSDVARNLAAAGYLSFGEAQTHVLELEFDRSRQSRSADLRPELPLILRW